MVLCDAHCHLQDPVLQRDLPAVLTRAREAGVSRLACCATRQEEWQPVLEIARTHPAVVPMLGIHPWYAGTDIQQHLCSLDALVRSVPSAGIGETGLDFRDRFNNREAQETGLIAHLDLARRLDRPVAVHCVRAWGRMLDLLREHPAPRILLHAYSGSTELVGELVERNVWFSFGATVMNPLASRVRDAVVAVPEERLLIETDAPDMPPPGAVAPNEPARLPAVLDAVAALRGVSADLLAETTLANSATFFGFD